MNYRRRLLVLVWYRDRKWRRTVCRSHAGVRNMGTVHPLHPTSLPAAESAADLHPKWI